MCRMVVVLMIVGLCVHTASALPGSGTQQDPWRIESLADFDEFAANPNYWAGFTRLETDVNLAGRTYSTAVIAPDVANSNYVFDGTPFTGVFDGNNHKITNLKIDDADAGNDYLGLFGCIGENAEVMNLGVEGGSVSGDNYVGGLVGGNFGGSLSNCYSSGLVSGTGSYSGSVGGLVGENTGSISDCHSRAWVNGTGSYSGSVGGLVGLNEGSVSNCYSTGDVNGVSYVGGLVGSNWNVGTVSNCHSTGNVSGGYWLGGLVGSNTGSISDCHSRASVNGTGSYSHSVGGLVGQNGYDGGSISNCYSIGNVNAVYRVGGLVGQNYASISNCYSTGDVNGDWGVGGLVGVNATYHAPQGHVFNSYSIGDVNGVSGVGGLVGANEANVSNCYSAGDVSGDSGVGGLVGGNGAWRPFEFPVAGYISNSYSTGDVQGDWPLGGLVGANVCGDIERSFWDVETSGEPNMCGDQGEYATGCDPNCGKTTAEMKTMRTFTDAGWDFVEIWGIGENQTYPYLRTEPAGDSNHDKKVDLIDLAILASHWLEDGK